MRNRKLYCCGWVYRTIITETPNPWCATSFYKPPYAADFEWALMCDQPLLFNQLVWHINFNTIGEGTTGIPMS